MLSSYSCLRAIMFSVLLGPVLGLEPYVFGSHCSLDPGDISLPVRRWCVDKYLASVWSSERSYGVLLLEYHQGSPPRTTSVMQKCQPTGEGCEGVALSRPGFLPAQNVTWFQAARFCENAGKVLIPAAVWIEAFEGTNVKTKGSAGLLGGSSQDSPLAACNINNPLREDVQVSGVRPTGRAGKTPGGTAACISRWGIEEMLGNVWEWSYSFAVEPQKMWLHASYFLGGFLIMGGNFSKKPPEAAHQQMLMQSLSPFHAAEGFGFRCARPLDPI